MQRLFLFLCATLAATTLLSAADAPTNPPAIQSRITQEGALARENLSESQRAKLREANEKFRTEQAPLFEKLRKARRELELAAQVDTPDERTIRAKASALGEVEGDLAVLRAKH